MAENPDNKLPLPGPVIDLCKWYWGKRGFLYGTIGLNILLGGIVTWAFTDSSALDKTPIGPLFHHPYGLLTIFLCILSLTIISGLITRLSAGVSIRQVKKQYLAQLETLYELLETTGVPELLMPRKVKLEEVFIPLQFHPSPPLGTYPLSESELEQYLEHRRRGTQEIDRLLLGEKDWEHAYRERECIEIEELWNNLKRDEPNAVIQGYPGMGKSTFLIRIVLSMARRSQHKKDPTMQTPLSPVLIPLFVSLKKFADAQEKSGQENLSLLEFIKLHFAREFAIPTLPSCIERWLSNCQCMILLDGLDDISKEEQRKAIQEEIKYFVRTQRHTEKQLPTYNRFLITSRVAGSHGMCNELS